MEENEHNVMSESSPGVREAVPSESGRSDSSGSDIGSVTYPYQSQMQYSSFPRCHLIKTSRAGVETYMRSLFMLGNGTPLWDPVGDLTRPTQALKSGVMIGDVGQLTHEGDFLYHFNIFLPPEDVLQRDCPPNFTPLHPPPGDDDITIKPTYFPPGTSLVSQGVTTTVHSSSPLDITFNIKARESGILVLPDGATREDLVSTSRITEYVQRYALEWYVFLNEYGAHLPFPNGSIYIVTGYDKASKWAVGTSGSRNSSVRGAPMTIRYQNHKWTTPFRGIGAKVSSADEGYGQCAVFIRGMRVALNISDWNRSILYSQPPRIIHFFHVLAAPVTGLRARFQSVLESRGSYKQLSVRVQARERIFQPTELLLRFLMEEAPSSNVAIAEDSMWCGVADSNHSSLQQIIELLFRVLQTHEIFSKDGEWGMVTLVQSTEDSQALSTSSLNKIIHLPTVINQRYQEIRRRRQTLNRIEKVFPGPGVPEGMLVLRRI